MGDQHDARKHKCVLKLEDLFGKTECYFIGTPNLTCSELDLS